MGRLFSAWLRCPIQQPPRALRGQAVIMMAIMLPVLVGFAGLVVDVGTLYVMKARLQNTVDAAALAGAQGLPDEGDAESIACDYIAANAVSGMTGPHCIGPKADIDTSEPNTITVIANREVPVTLMAVILGAEVLPTDVSARATVKIGSVGQECVFPLFVEVSSSPQSDQKYIPIQFTEPDAALIDDDNPNNGSSAIRDTMADPCAFNGQTTVGEEMDIKNGSTTQFKDGWVQIRDAAIAPSSACPNPDLSVYLTENDDLDATITFANCPRLKFLPVVPDGEYGGNDTAEVIGFTAFYFSDICEDNGCTYTTTDGTITVPKHKAWGYYLDMEISGGTYSDFDQFGTKVVVMTA